MNKLAEKALEFIYQCVVEYNWTINGIGIFSSGIVIDYREGRSQISFEAMGVSRASMPQVYQAFAQNFKFTRENINIDSITQYFLSMYGDDTIFARTQKDVAERLVQQIKEKAKVNDARRGGRRSSGYSRTTNTPSFFISDKEQAAFGFFGLDHKTATRDNVRKAMRQFAFANRQVLAGLSADTRSLAKASEMQSICFGYIDRRDASTSGAMGRWKWLSPLGLTRKVTG